MRRRPVQRPCGPVRRRPDTRHRTGHRRRRSTEVRADAIGIASDLRAAGLAVETGLRDRSVSSQLDYADTIGADHVVVVGERDLADGEVTVKDMESGEERQVDRDSITAEI
ncbi:MAG: His/Gly/Thr/Pro-type tRNA ligase C-terminal domain-containing protein [Candidatus Nanohaloarchaea archaeon]